MPEEVQPSLHELGYRSLNYSWYVALEGMCVTSRILPDISKEHIISLFIDETDRMMWNNGRSPLDKPRDPSYKFNQYRYDIADRLKTNFSADMDFDKFKEELERFAELYNSHGYDESLIKFKYHITSEVPCI